MRTICVIINNNLANYWTVTKITEDFPCFYNVGRIGKKDIEIAITCRQKDAKAIEDRLAKRR